MKLPLLGDCVIAAGICSGSLEVCKPKLQRTKDWDCILNVWTMTTTASGVAVRQT